MHLTAVHRHSASSEEVFRALTEPGLIRRRFCDLVGDPSAGAGAGGGTEVVVVREVDVVGALPQPLASPVLMIRERFEWGPACPDGCREGIFALEVRGAPLAVEGGIHIVPVDGGCDSIVEVRITTTMRVLGGRLLAPLRQHVGAWITASLASADRVLAEDAAPVVERRGAHHPAATRAPGSRTASGRSTDLDPSRSQPVA